MSPDFIPSQPEGVHLYPFFESSLNILYFQIHSFLDFHILEVFLHSKHILQAPIKQTLLHVSTLLPFIFLYRTFRYSKYREPEQVGMANDCPAQ